MSHTSERITGKGLVGTKLVTKSKTELEQVQLYVLHNDDEVEPYVKKHKDVLNTLNPNRSENWIARDHNQIFVTWFKNHIYLKLSKDPVSISEH